MNEPEFQTPFPQGLLSWASHREGGVRRAFVQGGRPTDEAFVESAPDHSLQSALVHHGARHLRETGAVVRPEHARTEDAIKAVLLTPDSERLIAALAPVIVWRIDALSLPRLRHDLATAGVDRRLGWVLDNTREVAQQLRPEDPTWARRCRRAAAVISSYLGGWLPEVPFRPERRDPLDRGLRSEKALQRAWDAGSPISRSWGIITRIQERDFAQALGEAAT